jgi:hypothetical protein
VTQGDLDEFGVGRRLLSAEEQEAEEQTSDQLAYASSASRKLLADLPGCKSWCSTGWFSVGKCSMASCAECPQCNQVWEKQTAAPKMKLGEAASATAKTKLAPTYTSYDANADPEIKSKEAGQKYTYNRNLEIARTSNTESVATLEDDLVTAKATADAAVVRLKESTANLKNAEDAPANAAWGDQPDYAGEMRLLDSDSWKMNSYMKFPIDKTLTDGDVVIEATLKVFKYGGRGGQMKLKTMSCSWGKGLTYTDAEVNPGGLVLQDVGAGDTSATIPEEGDKWMEVKLVGSVIQSARLQGDHVCIRLSGGPASGYATFGSDKCDPSHNGGNREKCHQPSLNLLVKNNPEVALKAEPLDVTSDDAAKMRARSKYKQKAQADLLASETQKEKEEAVKKTNLSDGELAQLKAKRAVFEKDPANPGVFDEWAGMSETALVAERDDAVNAKVSELVDVKTTEFEQRDDQVIATEMANSAYQAGTSDYQNEETAQRNAKQAARDTEIAAYKAQQEGIIRPQEEKAMRDKIAAEVTAKITPIDERIKDIPCKTLAGCDLTADQKSVVDSRVQSKLVTTMAAYDAKHGTATLNEYDVVTEQDKEEAKAKEMVEAEDAADAASNAAPPAPAPAPYSSASATPANAATPAAAPAPAPAPAAAPAQETEASLLSSFFASLGDSRRGGQDVVDLGKSDSLGVEQRVTQLDDSDELSALDVAEELSY